MNKVNIPQKEGVVVDCRKVMKANDVCRYGQTLESCDYECLDLDTKPAGVVVNSNDPGFENFLDTLINNHVNK